MNNIDLFFTNFQSVGDILYSLPIIETILKYNSNVNITYCTFKAHEYLLKHLPINLKIIDFDYRIKSGQDFWYKNVHLLNPENFHHFNIDFGGTNFESKHKYLTSEFEKKNLKINFPMIDPAFIELPEVDINVKPKSIYVENGISISRLDVNILNVDKMSLFFPKLNFYVTNGKNIINKNVYDCSNKNIIELANISKKCCAIVGHGSGPFVCTHSKENHNKLKIIYKEPIREWDLNNPNFININEEIEIIKILRSFR